MIAASARAIFGVAVTLATWIAASGCASAPPADDVRRIVIIIPGAGGHGPGTQHLIDGLREDLADAHFEVFHWGAPPPLFMLNLQNDAIHRDAERKLANRIEDRAASRPQARIDVVGHSAGCGVALGAMAQLRGPCITSAVLLSPSVSPGYDLHAAAANVRGNIHAFASDRDTLWLGWRASTFGTYDNVKTKAAGNVGFAHAPLNVVQYRYAPEWKHLGNDGGHFGALSRRFAREVLSPVLAVEAEQPPGSALARQGDDALRSGR